MNGGVDEKGWLKCRPVVGVCHNWLVMFGPVPPHRVEAQRGGLTFIGGLKGFQRTKEEHKCPHAPCWLSAYAAFITPSTINRTACPLVVKQKNLPPPPCAPAGGSRSSAIGRQRAWALERVQSAGRPFSPIKRRSLTRKRMSRVLIGSLWWSFKATPPPPPPTPQPSTWPPCWMTLIFCLDVDRSCAERNLLCCRWRNWLPIPTLGLRLLMTLGRLLADKV